MKKIVLALAALALASFVGVAHAQELPRYDVPAYCKTIAAYGGGSSALYNGCMQNEQTAYDDLKANWAGLSAQIKAYCTEIAAFGGNSYALFQGCVQNETAAADAPTTFKY